MCLQWHRSGEHQLHFHGSGKHRNSQGISQLNSVWEEKKKSSSAVHDCFSEVSQPVWLTEIPVFNVCYHTLQKDNKHPFGADVKCLYAIVKGHSDFTVLYMHGN